jgi:hypothetical protein
VPDVADVIAVDRPVHEDREGRAMHALLDVVGVAGQGWVMSWRDTRNGNVGLYLARVGLDGRLREPERPFPFHGAAFREVDPVVAAGPGLAGAVAWTTREHSPSWAFWGRTFGADGSFPQPESMLGLDESRSERGQERPTRFGHADLGLCGTVDERGNAIYAWLSQGRILSQRLAAGHGEPSRPECLNEERPSASGKPLLSAPGGHSVLAVWPTEGGLIAASTLRGSRLQSAGAGQTPRQLMPDPSGRGWWLVLEHAGELALRHLSDSGTPDRQDRSLAASPFGHVHVAAWSEGLVVLHQPDGRSNREFAVGGRFRLRFLEPDGSPSARAELDPLPESAASVWGARVSGAGSALLIAWSEPSSASTDVYARVLTKGQGSGEPPELGPVARLNSDQASAAQTEGRVAAAGGDSAAIAWLDSRDGSNRAYVRTVDSKGQPTSPERRLPARARSAQIAAAPSQEPELAEQVQPAMAVDGSFLVAWVTTRGQGRALRAQLFAAHAEARGPEFDVEATPGGVDGQGIGVLALPEGKGFLAAWPRGARGYALRRVEPRGEAAAPSGAEIELGEGPEAGDIALCLLDDGRILAAWDEAAGDGNQRLRARFLGPSLELDGPPIDFDTMWKHSDHDPSLAPGPKAQPGSFAMAWVNGEDVSRDVVARLFDRKGRPLGKPLAISTKAHEQDFPSLVRMPDGSWLCGFEDDLSHLDHTYVRRIQPGFESLGSVRNLNQRQPVYQENYQAPQLALVSSGVVAVWDDCRRSLGFDVFFKVIGPRFDR